MYLSDTHKPHPIPQPPPPQHSIDFCKHHSPSAAVADRDMILEIDTTTTTVTGKRRAETWVQEEIRSLITLRREIDSLFNTSKSNKHVWEQISGKMRGLGFDRSPTMCTDKWRNLLKEYKKGRNGGGNVGGGKMCWYKEMEGIMRDRARKWGTGGGGSGVRKGGTGIGNDDQIVRSLDRDMPLGIYSLHLDEGVTIKLYHYDESNHITVPTEEKTFYTEADLHDFLNRRGWSCLRELNGVRNIDNLDDLCHDALYHGLV
ncbi:Trihelix transcription factor GT-1-like protein [Drosera capensis]